MTFQDKILRFIELADACVQIHQKSGARPEVIYEACFGIYRDIQELGLDELDYYDPDSSYEKDTEALINALNNRADDYRKILTALGAG